MHCRHLHGGYRKAQDAGRDTFFFFFFSAVCCTADVGKGSAATRSSLAGDAWVSSVALVPLATASFLLSAAHRQRITLLYSLFANGKPLPKPYWNIPYLRHGRMAGHSSNTPEKGQDLCAEIHCFFIEERLFLCMTI